MKKHSALILVFAFCVFFSCTRDVGKVNRGDYPHEISDIISTSCAVSGCHNSASYLAAGGYNLQTWTDMFSGSSNGAPVIPYNSRFSSLCYFVNTYPELGIQNQPTMPLNRSPLSLEQVKTIKNWIDEGAPDINGKIWASDPARKKLYAVNQGCDVVTVFDAETQLPIRFIDVGNKADTDVPHQVRVSADGQYWYVVFINNNIMQKYRCSDDSYVGDIPLTPLAAGTGSENNLDWNTFVMTKDGKRAYCVSWTQNGRVSMVDLENRKLLKYSPVLYFPHAIALNSTEDKLYIGAQTGNFFTEFDADIDNPRVFFLDNSGTQEFNSTIDPHDMILSPDHENLVITCQKSNDVRVFNFASEQVTDIIPTGVYPQEIIYCQSTNQYFVSCTEDYTTLPGATGIITRIAATGYAVTHLKCGYQPHGIAVDEGRKLLYVLSRNISVNGPLPHHTSQCEGRNGFVNFVDLSTFTVRPERYELSSDPYFIYARP